MTATKTPSRSGNPHTFYFSDELTEALEKYVAQTRPKPSKKAVIEMLLEAFLEEKGCWPAAEER